MRTLNVVVVCATFKVRESRPISAAKETLSSDQQNEMSGNSFTVDYSVIFFIVFMNDIGPRPYKYASMQVEVHGMSCIHCTQYTVFRKNTHLHFQL